MYSAAVPIGRSHCPLYTQTRSPTLFFETLSPTAIMTPAPSLCGIISGYSINPFNQPARRFTSEGLTPEAHTFTNTPPLGTSGMECSPNLSTVLAGPTSLYQAAFIRFPSTVQKSCHPYLVSIGPTAPDHTAIKNPPLTFGDCFSFVITTAIIPDQNIPLFPSMGVIKMVLIHMRLQLTQ